MESAFLYADGSRGIYIPQHFAGSVVREKVFGVTEEDWSILEAGPDHELYWEAWNDVIDNATIETDGMVYCLFQDGDLWLVDIERLVEWAEEQDWADSVTLEPLDTASIGVW